LSKTSLAVFASFNRIQALKMKFYQFCILLINKFTSESPLLKSIQGILVNGLNFALINSRVAFAAIPEISDLSMGESFFDSYQQDE
jgi:hypothetical protein